ncbi:CheR family methyltransferase [Cystobacter ferrugineus]|uniref:MCP methyltransferase cheR-type with TPR repeats n=1 Tax=Cystobacter ferrugineus TaxID=83449 RepID=A0A3Q8I3T8_9BACT|nr:protein-glutamate O-methyltransferase CheR [Cystobacter ferrugineus]AYM53529.1 MCP methyltransferase cheR-type with TPR repeats [Cystobacter ferrugineus]
MTEALSRSPLARFTALVERRLGLHYEPEQWDELAPLLFERSASRGVEGYLSLLSSSGSEAEWRALAERLTVGETYFLRHPAQLEVLVSKVLPSLAQPGASLRVLCAGCSTGEEPYSIALLCREQGKVDPSQLRVLGIDVNPRAIAHARNARYSTWSLRSVPVALRERWFQRSSEGFFLRPALRDQVLFEERNLLEEAPAFWAPASFHVILCRNVMLYFPPEVTRKIIARMSQALVPGGYLFLGPSETLRGISEDFELLRSADAFYYRRKAPAPATAAEPARTPVPETSAKKTPGPLPLPALEGLDSLLPLLDAERYAEAWTRLEALPQAAQPQGQLLRAVLHLNAGRFAEAALAGQQLLSVRDTEASAHFLLGVCLEHSGDEAGARNRYAAAARADPTFALSHLRAGTLARRAGNVAEARVALRMALSLLPQEKPLRLTLFGGGFGRHGLMQVGLRELQACTEVP